MLEGFVAPRLALMLAASAWLASSCTADADDDPSAPDRDRPAFVDAAITAALPGSDDVARLDIPPADDGAAATDSTAASSQAAAVPDAGPSAGAAVPAPDAAIAEPDVTPPPSQPAEPAPSAPASPMMSVPAPDPCDRAESCDGTDEDCDGHIDEDFSLLTDPTNCGHCGQVCTGLLQACCTGVCKTLCVL